MMKNNNLIITMCLDPYRYPTCCVTKLILTLISEQSNDSSLWKQRQTHAILIESKVVFLQLRESAETQHLIFLFCPLLFNI